jgi:hypothetical protein
MAARGGLQTASRGSLLTAVVCRSCTIERDGQLAPMPRTVLASPPTFIPLARDVHAYGISGMCCPLTSFFLASACKSSKYTLCTIT